MTLPLMDVVEWYIAASPREAGPAGVLCPTRDVFQARLDTFYHEICARNLLDENNAALLAAVCGEIGNNCFDHNLGQWPDAIGCCFSFRCESNTDTVLTCIADRGQGLLNSLKRVVSGLTTEAEAVRIAFEQKISGRSLERRGNGLKFVRSVINGSEKRGLFFHSGSSGTEFGGFRILERWPFGDKIRSKDGTGTLAVIVWEPS